MRLARWHPRRRVATIGRLWYMWVVGFPPRIGLVAIFPSSGGGGAGAYSEQGGTITAAHYQMGPQPPAQASNAFVGAGGLKVPKSRCVLRFAQRPIDSDIPTPTDRPNNHPHSNPLHPYSERSKYYMAGSRCAVSSGVRKRPIS